MEEFVVIDLISQSSAVAKYVKGWETSQILEWLGERGELAEEKTRFGKHYRFTSALGREAIFYLDFDKFTFVVEHTTFTPKVE
jgi:hypothetical protein